MIPFREALRALLGQARPINRTETVPTLYAEGRILAEDIVSTVDVPPADNSQMDGYAVCSEDLAAASESAPVALPVLQRIPAHVRLARGGESAPCDCVQAALDVCVQAWAVYCRAMAAPGQCAPECPPQLPLYPQPCFPPRDLCRPR